MREHLVQFYDDERRMVAEVGSFIGPAVAVGGAGLVIAARSRLAALEADIESKWDGGDASPRSRLVSRDAEGVLERFMVGDWPDDVAFESEVGSLVDEAGKLGNGRVRAYGEMVALLCQQGLGRAALRVEELWNRLAGRRRFSLLCGYPMGAFPRHHDHALFEQICAVHSRVLPSHTLGPNPSPDAMVRRIARLEQKVHALDAEVEARRRAEKTLAEMLDRAGAAEGRDREVLLAMAYELLRPLEPMRDVASLLRRPGAPEAEFGRAAELLDREAQHLARWVDDLLELMRIDRGKVELEHVCVEFRAIVAQCVQAAQAGFLGVRGQTLNAELPPAEVCVQGDPSRLAHAIGNVLRDAARFGVEGGAVELSLAAADDGVRLRVRSEGIDIDTAMPLNAHEPLSRGLGHDPGSGNDGSEAGIGYTLARRLIELHGGTLHAASAGIGRGAVFEIVLPLPPAGHADGASGAAREAGDGAGAAAQRAG